MRKIIRNAIIDDIPEIMQVFSEARQIMRKSGNAKQWAVGYPSSDVLISDIERRGAYVVLESSQIVGYFAFLPSPEPTYNVIYCGKWLDHDAPYHVVHRIAKKNDTHGVFGCIMEFCFKRESNIRIDTHRDNIIMQHLLNRHGFSYCGIIHLQTGDERLAYQIIWKKQHSY